MITRTLREPSRSQPVALREPSRSQPVAPREQVVSLPRWRLIAVGCVLGAAMLSLAAKSARLQLVLGDDLKELAEDQYMRRVTLSAPRGEIFDRDGRPLAVSVPAWSVVVRPPLVEDKVVAADALAQALGLPRADVLSKLVSDAKYVWLVRRASADVADAVRALGIPGVELKQETRRSYPQKQLAGHLLGIVDVDGRPRGGVEHLFDDNLKGRAQTVPGLVDGRGDRIALASGLDVEMLEGDDVILTIDAELQHVVEGALAEILQKYKAKGAWALVMDAQTGAIRAAATAPAFNPNAPSVERARNRALAEAFEPGSIFKIATFAAALDAGVLSPDERINCENGKFQVGKHVIHDTHRAEWLTAREVFAQSSNIGTLKIAQRLGEERFKEALKRYGFGAAPGTGLVEETAGKLPSARWGEARLATVSFGHGLMTSALQIASFTQAVANGGVRKTPYIFERVETTQGEIVRRPPRDDGERVLGAEAARVVTDIMKGVAKDGGTGLLAAIPGIEVAGKTGTAEKVDPLTKRYTRDRHLSSFVGFAPADKPRVVAVVIVDEPQGEHFGGIVAAPAWRQMVERALVDENVIASASLTPPLTPPVPGLAPGRVPEGAAIDPVGEKERARLDGKIPDLRGLTARAAIRKAEEAGLDVRVEGSGVVVKQESTSNGVKIVLGGGR